MIAKKDFTDKDKVEARHLFPEAEMVNLPCWHCALRYRVLAAFRDYSYWLHRVDGKGFAICLRCGGKKRVEVTSGLQSLQ